jgi:hypothetical protein
VEIAREFAAIIAIEPIIVAEARANGADAVSDGVEFFLGGKRAGIAQAGSPIAASVLSVITLWKPGLGFCRVPIRLAWPFLDSPEHICKPVDYN